MRKLRVVRADPAGNITLFVLTPVGKAECAAVATQLMAIRELQAEQVGFIFPNGHMEMEAGEFCGNASRAYGFLLAKQQGLAGCRSMQLSVSGCDHPITVTVDMDAGTAEAEMPLPKFVRPVDALPPVRWCIWEASPIWWCRMSRPAVSFSPRPSRSLRRTLRWMPTACASWRGTV